MHGTWKFQGGDDVQWADPAYDDTGWAGVQVPGDWQQQGLRTEGKRAWYRKTFAIPPELKGRRLGVALGYIDS
ncbi:MAG: glycoside hydrolase, partial [Verrucomicrobiota bacterium]